MQLGFRGFAFLGFEFSKDEAALFMGHDNIGKARRACGYVSPCPGH
jgi:hypothetical protein